MRKRKLAAMLLAIAMCGCFATGIFAATADTARTYYNQDGSELVWAFDQNGISTQIPYNQDGSAVNAYYGMYSPETCYREREDGSVFVLAAAKYMLVGGDLDVTKDIVISFTMDPNDAWSNAGLGRFFFALFDTADEVIDAGNNAWNSSATGSKLVAFGGMKEGDGNYHRIGVGSAKSREVNYDGGNAVLTIRIGAAAGESAVLLNGESFATFAATQSDFADGKAHLSFVALDATLEAKIKISQISNEPDPVDPAPSYPTDSKTYYDADGNVLDWAFDQNGISEEIPYNQDGSLVNDRYGMYAPENCYTVKEDGSIFVLPATKYMLIGEAFDVTQAIEITFTMDPSDAWSGKNNDSLGRFFFALFNHADTAIAAGNDAWKSGSGSLLTAFGSMNEKLPSGDDCAYYHRISVAGARGGISDAFDYDGNSAKLTIYIGETAEESFVAFNGKAFASFDAKQSDFPDGTARLTFIALEHNLEAKIKVTQADISTKVHLKSATAGFPETTVNATIGMPLNLPEAPAIAGYTFDGWYLDETGIVGYDFDYPVTGETTLYAKYLENGKTYHIVTLQSEKGDYQPISFKVESGTAIGKIGNVFYSEGFSLEWKTADGAYSLDTPVNGDLTLTAVWVEDTIVLYHKMNGVVDQNYLWEYLAEENGFDEEYTSFDIGDTFVDADGNEIISQYYGSYQHDTSFKTYDQYTDFLLPAVGAITNLKRLDLTKEIVITFSVNNWDTANNSNPAAGDITFQLFDNVLSALKAGHSGTQNVKAAILTSTVDASVNYGRFRDVINNVRSENIGYEQDKQFVLKLFISEDGTQNYATVNGVAIEGALAGLKRDDFKGGYAYLHIANLGSTHMYRCLVAQTSVLTLGESENGTYTADKKGEVLYKDQITLTLTPAAGYAVKKVTVGGKEYMPDANNIVTFYKGWEDETVEVTFERAFTLTFETNGGSAINAQTACEGDVFYKPSNPKREGYQFVGWYTDEALTQVYDFKTPATANLTLYAKWEATETPGGGCDCGGTIGFGSALLALAAIGAAGIIVKAKKKD